jgi:histone-arginine methyltransferase CARM1
MDYTKITMDELKEFTIPINWTLPFTGIIHGIAAWFDIHLGTVKLSTAPTSPNTHWQQVRFLLREPLAVNAFETVSGYMKLKVNDQRSYDMIAELVIGDFDTEMEQGPASRIDIPGKRCDMWKLHEQTYWYS